MTAPEPATAAVAAVRPIESFETAARELALQFRPLVEEHLRDGWVRDGFSIPSVFPPIDWNAHNRSFSYHLHAWDAIANLLLAHSRFGDPRYLEASIVHARSWLDKFQLPVLGRDSDEELDALVLPVMPVEWYDMAVGLRAYRIAYMLDCMLRQTRYESDISIFKFGLYFHLKLLARDHFFRVHSNHGLYQALGQTAAARRFVGWPGMADHYAQGLERLNRLLVEQFCEEGPHREHSPGYHYMLMGTITNTQRSGLLEEPEFRPMLAAISEAFQWMVQPNRGLATFGDTDPRIVVRGDQTAALYTDPSVQFIISGGSQGRQPPTGVKSFPEAGYAMARLHAPGVEPTFENASYLAQMAAFHSRVHKHADDLGFIWYDRGRDILIDPGRYAYAGRTEVGSDLFNQGFWYSDPKRVYVESTRAHNCVEIDGQSYARKVRPTGSALRYAAEQGGLAVTECEATQFRAVRHRRALVMAPGRFLLVCDWLNDRAAEHDYRQWFQFAPEWELSKTDDPNILKAVATGEGGSDTLHMVNLLPAVDVLPPIRGQTEPVLQGWMSDAPYSLVPTTSVAIRGESRQMAHFATLFVFGAKPTVDPSTRFNKTMKNGLVAWSDETGQNRIVLSRDEADAIAVDWRATAS